MRVGPKHFKGGFYWQALGPVFAALALGACKTAETADTASVAIQNADAHGKLLQGSTVFIADEGQIARFFCNEKTIATDVNLDDLGTLKRSCRLQRSARGQVTIADFGETLKKAYLVKVGDPNGYLNSGEQAVLDHVLKNLQPGTNQVLKAGIGEQAALDMVGSRFAQVMDAAYDGKAVHSDQDSTLVASSAPSPDGFALAGGPQNLGSVQFRANTEQVVVQGQPRRANLISFGLSSVPGDNCQAQISTIEGAYALSADGQTVQVPVNPNPVATGSYIINNGQPVDVFAVAFGLRNGLLGRLQMCQLAVTVEDTTLGDTSGSSTAGTPGGSTLSVDDRMKQLMTTRSHRLWHYLWHGIRNAWARMSQQERSAVRQYLGTGWVRNDAETVNIPQPNRGEEFLHMHREMVAKVATVLGAQMYAPWAQPPAPNDPQFPLPGGNTRQSNAEYAQYLTWHQQAVALQTLRSMTLSQYGEWLEANIHNSMHNRWSDPRTANPQIMAGGIFQQPRPEWDLPSQDNLVSPYTSHANPLFWRIHGYVDQRVDDWLRANNYTSIAMDCRGVQGCYQWQRIWTGPIPPSTTSNPVSASTAAASASLTATTHHDLGFDPNVLPSIPKSLARMISDNANMVATAPAIPVAAQP